MRPPDVTLRDIEMARERISGHALRTPMIPYMHGKGNTEIFLKLENLQPIGSFKIRGAGNAMLSADAEELKNGVFTCSAGNMAQGVAWMARSLGIPCHVVVPDHAPKAKLTAIEALGATYIKEPFETWWKVMATRNYPGLRGLFVHPVSDPAVIAGNGTIGLEILEELPDVNAIVVPYGGGGLSCGISIAVRSQKPAVKVYASEVETAAPLAASLSRGKPTEVKYQKSFVDGIGSASLLSEMWPLARHWLEDSLVVTLQQVAESIRDLFFNGRVIAEGAGASSLAAACSGKLPGKKIVCVISGGNIDPEKLITALEGKVPGPD